MFSKTILIAALIASAINVPSQAKATADDYTFEPTKPELQKGDTTISVRLIQESTGKPVSDAVILQTRIDMGPDGMPTMDAPLTPAETSEPGVYSFKTSLPMAGQWQLSIAVKVQGEAETVTGKIIYKVMP